MITRFITASKDEPVDEFLLLPCPAFVYHKIDSTYGLVLCIIFGYWAIGIEFIWSDKYKLHNFNWRNNDN